MSITSINKAENIILAERAIFRANSGLYFIDACLTHFHRGGTDFAYSRSLYILFSYSFELILKSRILLASKKTLRADLVKEIKSHNLEGLSKMLSLKDLGGIGITKIKRRDNNGFVEYLVETVSDGQIIIQDFIDVRYDFDKDTLRNTNQDEATKMKSDFEFLLKATKIIMAMLEKSSTK